MLLTQFGSCISNCLYEYRFDGCQVSNSDYFSPYLFIISDFVIETHRNYTMSDSEIPLMVATQRTNSKPKFSCILVDRGKKFSTLYQEVSADLENNNADVNVTPSVKVSTSEGGDSIPFHMRISIDQASKMLRSDVLWVTFQFPSEKSAPSLNTRNAFDVLKLAQTTKKSLPAKYPKPINGSFELFNKLVSLCQETQVFFRYYYFLHSFSV